MTPADYKSLSNSLRQFLAELGAVIDVTHARPTCIVIATKDENVYDNVFSKVEFRELGLDSEYNYGEEVLSHGGFTRVDIVFGETVLTGKYNFKPNEVFCKAKGIVNAIRDAAKKHKKLLSGFNERVKGKSA